MWQIEICEECKKATEVACPRNVDVECLLEKKRLCAHHMDIHLQVAHQISISWRGELKG